MICVTHVILFQTHMLKYTHRATDPDPDPDPDVKHTGEQYFLPL